MCTLYGVLTYFADTELHGKQIQENICLITTSNSDNYHFQQQLNSRVLFVTARISHWHLMHINNLENTGDQTKPQCGVNKSNKSKHLYFHILLFMLYNSFKN